MKRIIITIAILLLTTIANAQTYTVERVIDGDTLKLTNGERVRLIGIDCPESKPNDKAKRDSERTGRDLETINDKGKKATEYVKGLIKPGDKVKLEFDVQKRDKYGRLLAYVYLVDDEDSGDGYFDLNFTIMNAGYAMPLTIPPNVRYENSFKKLYKKARKEGRGLWREDNSNKGSRLLKYHEETNIDDANYTPESYEELQNIINYDVMEHKLNGE